MKKNIRIEVPQDLHQFLAKVQAKSKEKGGKKISLAELLLNYALTGIHFAKSEDADRLSPTEQIISVGSTSIALPNLISATQTTLSEPQLFLKLRMT